MGNITNGSCSFVMREWFLTRPRVKEESAVTMGVRVLASPCLDPSVARETVSHS